MPAEGYLFNLRQTYHMKIYNHLLRSILPVVLLFAVTTANVQAQNLAAPLPTDPKVIKGKFDNGLTYYIRPNNKPEKKVELRLAVNAGSILEDNDQQGLAHFLEHMNFNGTRNFKKNELVNYLQSIGVKFGADLNAYTSFDETVYILPIPTDKAGNLEKGFQIIEDWAHNALLTDKDIDEERAVVLEESRLGKGAGQRMRDQYLPYLLAGSKYAERLPIGKDDILKSFKYETIRKFYRDWYRPDLQAVAVVGDIDTATAMKLLRKHFATLKNPAKSRERFVAEVPVRQHPEALVVTDKEATNYVLQIIFPVVKEESERTVGDYRDFLKKQLVTQMLNTRLNDLARGGNPPFPFASTNFGGWARGYENFSAVTLFSKEGPEKALMALTGELLRARDHGFTQSELEIVKKNMLSNIERSYNERNTTNSDAYVDEYVRNFLEGEPMPGIENEYEYYKTLLPGITVAELNKLAKERLTSANTFALINGPENNEVPLPTSEELLALTQKGFDQKIGAMAEKAIAGSLIDKIPTPGKVTGKNTDAELGITTYTLSNGVKVTVKPTDFKTDEIILKGVKKGGTNSYGLADKENATHTVEVIDAMGIGNFTPTDLEKALAGKTVSMNANMGNIENTLSGMSNVKDFETMLQLLYLQATAPRIDEQLFNAYKDKEKSMLQFLPSNPQLAFMDTNLKFLYANNPLVGFLPEAKEYDKIELKRVMEIYKNEFGSADGYQFFIVGNVDEKTAIPLIETYIGSLPAANKTPTFKDNGVRPIKGAHTLKFNKGKDPKSLIMATYHGDIKFSEDKQLQARALAEVLNIKVIEQLREKLGGIYSGRYSANVKKEPYESFVVSLRLPCGPENVDKLLATANEEIKTMKEKGPDKKDLDKVKTQWHETHRTKLKENGYWTGQLESILFWGKDKNHLLKYDAWVDQLKPADLQNMAKLLFDGKNELVSILYPES